MLRQRWWHSPPGAHRRLPGCTPSGRSRASIASEVPQVVQAMKDPDPGVRENAIVLSERWLPQAVVSEHCWP